jgi:hypothetical protein
MPLLSGEPSYSFNSARGMEAREASPLQHVFSGFTPTGAPAAGDRLTRRVSKRIRVRMRERPDTGMAEDEEPEF